LRGYSAFTPLHDVSGQRQAKAHAKPFRGPTRCPLRQRTFNPLVFRYRPVREDRRGLLHSHSFRASTFRPRPRPRQSKKNRGGVHSQAVRPKLNDKALRSCGSILLKLPIPKPDRLAGFQARAPSTQWRRSALCSSFRPRVPGPAPNRRPCKWSRPSESNLPHARRSRGEVKAASCSGPLTFSSTTNRVPSGTMGCHQIRPACLWTI
jgi:hypothetical protein